MTPNHLSQVCTSGHICPTSGIWESIGNFKTTCLVSQGHKMPYYCNQKTIWMLIQIG
ncbi:hypothetical protein J2X97_000799 [Epilithonimonas hungarica]|jgi:hypothetical protein|uniref:hypothetical protein n=1 Tax=Epilithonimonas hungarica TaxID=454006 RepID=UPI00278106CC|nr:hypothetical protein [Epilithonimonas hungarica]MDP9955162.1 hypothetical protein [Epilithonimonas hungarica]